MSYAELTHAELAALRESLEQEYARHCAKELALNMARGKPAAAQLELSLPLLDTVDASSGLFAEDGTDSWAKSSDRNRRRNRDRTPLCL